MNRVISWLQNTLVRVILTLTLVGVTVLLSAVIDTANSLQAQAEPLTPEATMHQVNSQDSPFRKNDQEKVNELFKENKNPQTASETTREIGETLTKSQKNIKKNVEKARDTVKENLHLDQQPPLDERVDDVVNSLKTDRN
ncbi:MAG TPA: hypothetical protein V6C91_03580 [Coleofasciculaceae cyanobacterium]